MMIKIARMGLLLVVMSLPLNSELMASNPMVHTSPATMSLGPGPITYTWGEIKDGDCHQTNGTLTVRNDGSATFDADVRTDKSTFGDVWHANFQWYETNRRQYWMIPSGDSRRTKGQTVHMHSDWHGPKFDLNHMKALGKSQMYQESSC